MTAKDARSDLGVPAHCILTNLGIADLLTLSFVDETDNVKEMFTNLALQLPRHPVPDCATRPDSTRNIHRKPPSREALVPLQIQRQMSPTQTQMHHSPLMDAGDHLTELETLSHKLM